MRTRSYPNGLPFILSATAVLALVTVLPISSLAQDASAEKGHADHKDHAEHGQTEKPDLVQELRALQTKIASLEAALKQNHQAAAPDASAHDPDHGKHGTSDDANMGAGKMQMESMGGKKMGMEMMSGKGMGGMNMGGTSDQGKGMMSGMGGMSGQSMGGMGMGMMSGMGGASGQGMGMGGMGMGGMQMMGGGMGMMGRMKGMGSMQMTTALPGFPGASHIYHVGSTNFFLDHPQHITLSQEQQTKLNQIKKQALLDQATFDRWIDAGEQELWVLTSADAPEADKIEAKIREIEKQNSDKRISFIRAVGEAARVLTDQQRQALVGQLPAEHTSGGTTTQN